MLAALETKEKGKRHKTLVKNSHSLSLTRAAAITMTHWMSKSSCSIINTCLKISSLKVLFLAIFLISLAYVSIHRFIGWQVKSSMFCKLNYGIEKKMNDTTKTLKPEILFRDKVGLHYTISRNQYWDIKLWWLLKQKMFLSELLHSLST